MTTLPPEPRYLDYYFALDIPREASPDQIRESMMRTKLLIPLEDHDTEAFLDEAAAVLLTDERAAYDVYWDRCYGPTSRVTKVEMAIPERSSGNLARPGSDVSTILRRAGEDVVANYSAAQIEYFLRARQRRETPEFVAQLAATWSAASDFSMRGGVLPKGSPEHVWQAAVEAAFSEAACLLVEADGVRPYPDDVDQIFTAKRPGLIADEARTDFEIYFAVNATARRAGTESPALGQVDPGEGTGRVF